jgi:hypothetical protein
MAGSTPIENSSCDPHRERVFSTAGRRDVVVDAELKRLVRELRAFGPLKRSTLARRSHATTWHGSAFGEAVSAGVASGRLRLLPFDFIAASAEGSSDAPARARAARRLRAISGAEASRREADRSNRRERSS